jgi:hypothetical protein
MKTALCTWMIVSGVLLAGCGGEATGGSGGGATSSAASGATGGSGGGATSSTGGEVTSSTGGGVTSSTGTGGIAGSDLDGTWETACSLLPTQMLYARTRLVYQDLKLTGTYSDYSDAACTMGMGVSTWTGTAKVGDAAAPSGATPLDLAFESYKYKPLNDKAASINNMYMYCGLSDWAAAVEQDVLDRPCYGFAIPTSGKSLDIYRTEGTTLKFGKGAKISVDPVEADRPTVIDDTRVFTKVAQ